MPDSEEPIDGAFIAIGHIPRSEVVADLPFGEASIQRLRDRQRIEGWERRGER